jgi:hypothetical protein
MHWAHTCGSWRAGDYRIVGFRDLAPGEKPFLLLEPREGGGICGLGTYDTLEGAMQRASLLEATRHRYGRANT